MESTYEPTAEGQQAKLATRAEQLLLRLRISPRLAGYRYHTAAIVRAVQHPECVRLITKDVYPTIARQYETTPSRVERAMRTALIGCWAAGGSETLDEMAGYHLTERPTNSEFVALVAAYIRHRA